MLIACVIEAVIGYPNWLYALVKHPVVWIGAVIDCLDKHFNKTIDEPNKQRFMGVLSMLVLLTITVAIALLIGSLGYIAEIIATATLLAGRSLYAHVNAVYKSLKANNLDGARNNLAKIVGRDTQNLDEAEVDKAAIESLAESFSDGVIAPIFFAMFGLPALVAYKAINTADSMIGHKTTKYLYYGWAAARLDDIANYIPARISAVLIAIASTPNTIRSLKTVSKDGAKHASPNSGYPEAAMAGSLGICLGGVRSYDGEIHNAPLIGEEFSDAIKQKHLETALNIYLVSCAIVYIFIALIIF